MNRTFVAALFAGIAALPAHAVRTVDIGDSRALDTLRVDSPEHYKMVMGILQAASHVECETLPQMLKAQYGATDVQCSAYLILTSYPAKRHLSFKLDDTAFAGNVPLTGKRPTLQKAHATPLTPP